MPTDLSIEAFPAWAHLNHVQFKHVKLQEVGAGKGLGLLADSDLDGASGTKVSSEAVVRIPHDLVLSAEAIEDYAKVDHNFKQLLEAAGRQVSISAANGTD
jgi:hypothetical protein